MEKKDFDSGRRASDLAVDESGLAKVEAAHYDMISRIVREAARRLDRKTAKRAKAK